MKLTQSEIIEALKESEGNVTEAAKMLNVPRSTVRGRISKSVKIQDALDEIKEIKLEKVEHSLYELATMTRNYKAITTYLEYFGKSKVKNEDQINGEINITFINHPPDKENGS